ncbi:hypothetical protein ACI3KW_02530 [Devosia sp. ZW T5_3]|uniref:hypothetical protein n=1 Tax=Devosia sp. ZW T5_3 TaxID=3378085 RepID=UPI0038519212
MRSKSHARLNRQFDKIQRRAPGFAAGWLERVRRPEARWIRIPLGFLLVLGGIFSFLPVLGLWMLPLGLLLLALDLVFLQGPVNHAIVRGTRKWSTWRRARRDKKAQTGS